MTTPILDYLKAYQASDISRLHMPGHKGASYLGFEALDITEIRGADELYCPDGIIAESERNAAELFGSGITAYSTEGSSHAIRSMIFLARQLTGAPEHAWLLAGRNAHKSLLYSAAICDLNLEWIYPSLQAENSIAACQPSPEELENKLRQMKEENRLPFAVFLTSPDYLGQIAPLFEMSEICHRSGCLLLVDNAHGAYLHFLPTPCHPMDLGADMCCDSAHKTLPVLTGGAYLHLRKGLGSQSEVKAAMELSGTTSPSYLIMASLDQCNKELSDTYPRRLKEVSDTLCQWKQELLKEGIPILSSESMKVVVSAAAMGFTGIELGDLLREHLGEPEFCDPDYLVCMITPDNRAQDLERLSSALRKAASFRREPRMISSLQPVRLSSVMTVRQAVFAPHEFVPVEASVGRICGAPTVSCPPAVPIAISGERITEQAANLMLRYGFSRVSVVK